MLLCHSAWILQYVNAWRLFSVVLYSILPLDNSHSETNCVYTHVLWTSVILLSLVVLCIRLVEHVKLHHLFLLVFDCTLSRECMFIRSKCMHIHLATVILKRLSCDVLLSDDFLVKPNCAKICMEHSLKWDQTRSIVTVNYCNMSTSGILLISFAASIMCS